jgi:RNA polymerase sigma-70 factor (sigma-E family)
MNRAQEAEFDTFVAGSGARLLRTAVLLTGDYGHAEDLVQTALERTARRWTKLEGAPEAYARVVLARLATDRWRRQRSRLAEVAVDPPEVSQGDLASEVVDRQSLTAALFQLTQRQRAVLVLRYFNDLSEAQTADALGVSVGTVKSTTSRAIVRLRELVPDLASIPPTLEVPQ